MVDSQSPDLIVVGATVATASRIRRARAARPALQPSRPADRARRPCGRRQPAARARRHARCSSASTSPWKRSKTCSPPPARPRPYRFPAHEHSRDRDRRRRLHRLARRRRAARRRRCGDRDRRPLLRATPRSVADAARAVRARHHRRSPALRAVVRRGQAPRGLPSRRAGERRRLGRESRAATARSTCRARSTCSRPPAVRGACGCSPPPAARCTATTRRGPRREERIPAPLSPYGASKWAAEAYVNTWSLSSGIPHAVCRLGNVYGPRQNPHGEAGVVAIFADHLYTDRAPKLYGHGAPTRDYVYVGDVVSALLAASGRAGTYNIATGVETDVLTVWTRAERAGRQADRAASSPTCARASSRTAAWTSAAPNASWAGARRCRSRRACA